MSIKDIYWCIFVVVCVCRVKKKHQQIFLMLILIYPFIKCEKSAPLLNLKRRICSMTPLDSEGKKKSQKQAEGQNKSG